MSFVSCRNSFYSEFVRSPDERDYLMAQVSFVFVVIVAIWLALAAFAATH
jgi:hypothetical protein